jgi:hypothetical protein
MNDKIVSYKTAKLAIKKSFDLIQRHGVESSLYNKKGKHTYYANYGFMYSGLSEGYISAPTQSFLHAWLLSRKIFVDVQPIDDWSEWSYRILCEDIMSPFYVAKENDGPFKSYQDAMEHGLYESLKLFQTFVK